MHAAAERASEPRERRGLRIICFPDSTLRLLSLGICLAVTVVALATAAVRSPEFIFNQRRRQQPSLQRRLLTLERAPETIGTGLAEAALRQTAPALSHGSNDDLAVI